MFISWEYILLALIILSLIIAWGQTANKHHPQKMTRKEYRNLCKALRFKNDKLLDKTIIQIIEKHYLWIKDEEKLKNQLKRYFQLIWKECKHSDKYDFCILIPKPESVESFLYFHSETPTTKTS